LLILDTVYTCKKLWSVPRGTKKKEKEKGVVLFNLTNYHPIYRSVFRGQAGKETEILSVVKSE
jgi:hypothetical protein